MKKIPRAERGFALTFSDRPFTAHDVVLALLRPDELEGNWYHGHVSGLRMECWLCPALFLLFSHRARKDLRRWQPAALGVNPIWEPPDNTEPRRFIEAPQ